MDNRVQKSCLTFEQIHRDCIRRVLTGGSYRFIRCPVNYKDERIGAGENNDDYFLCFNYHDVNGRYECEVPEKEFRKAYAGKQYYLVLREARGCRTEVIEIYDGNLDLDETMSQMLERDAYLTGEEISREEADRRKRKAQATVKIPAHVVKFTPEEEKIYEPEMKKLAQEAKRWVYIGVIMTAAVYGSIYSRYASLWMFSRKIILWERLLYVIVWICGGIYPLLKYVIPEINCVSIILRMNYEYKKPVFRVILWCLTVIANLMLGIALLSEVP